MSEMVYPDSFHRIVVIGKIYTETFNFTLAAAPTRGAGSLGTAPVTDALCSAIANVIADWFRDVSPLGNPVNALLISAITSVKVNRIGPNGRYTDPETREHVFGSPQPGNAVGNAPAQVATAVTLTTAAERGRASKGRFFLPPIQGWVVPGSDGRASTVQAGALAAASKRLLDQINDVYDALPSTDSSKLRIAVASNIGTGTFREVTGVRVGRVPDTMRSRRTSLLEDPQTATLSSVLEA